MKFSKVVPADNSIIEEEPAAVNRLGNITVKAISECCTLSNNYCSARLIDLIFVQDNAADFDHMIS